MPQHPEERRATWPLWVAVIALLAGGAVVLMVRQRAPAGGPPFAPPQAPDTQYMSRLRSLEEVTGAADPARLSGYRVELANLPVVAVDGRAFWVADPQGRRIMAVPNNPNTPADAVREGATVSITGAVVTPGSPEEIAHRKGLDPQTATRAAEQRVYLRADSIRRGAADSTS